MRMTAKDAMKAPAMSIAMREIAATLNFSTKAKERPVRKDLTIVKVFVRILEPRDSCGRRTSVAMRKAISEI